MNEKTPLLIKWRALRRVGLSLLPTAGGLTWFPFVQDILMYLALARDVLSWNDWSPEREHSVKALFLAEQYEASPFFGGVHCFC
jgi:hypothetical protein